MRARRRDNVPPLRLPMAYCRGCVRVVRLGTNRVGVLLRAPERAYIDGTTAPIAPLHKVRG
jgi:hypothetical protein